MADFAKRAKEKNSSVLLFQHEKFNDSNPSLIRKRLRRVKEIVSSSENHWRQWVLTHNCESAANYVSYGKIETKQGQLNLVTLVIAAGMNKGLGGVARGYYDSKTGNVRDTKNKNCRLGTCIDRDMTSNGCVCKTSPETSILYGKYCYVDGKLYKSEGRKDDRGIWGTVKGKKRMCLRKGKKKEKYLNC